MNQQEKRKAGKLVGRGVQWCTHTWNYVGGCYHACRWQMPDGEIAECYAKDVAEGIAQAFYPNGFEHHYFHPERLDEPLKLKEHARIFLDSMADLMGHWVPDDQILAVLDVCRRAHWHDFQLLTKNAPRLLKFREAFPLNLWVGASTPPDFMFGKRLERHQQIRMLDRTLAILAQIDVPVRWMSVEPLSWDVAPIFAANKPLQWAVIGAASNGPVKYQPDPRHVQNLLDVFAAQRVPVFFKGNLEWTPWLEYFPGFVPSPYMAHQETP